MSKRCWIAGVLGGIAMFLWSGLAHDVLPLGTTGIKEIATEAPFLTAVRAAGGDSSGFYIFPGIGLGLPREQQRAAMQKYPEKVAANPSGILIYHPPGQGEVMGAKLLGTEFLTELVETLLAAFLLSLTRLATFGARAGFITLVGVLAAITTNIPYWNWYGFPASYTVAYMSIEIIGFLVAGLVAAVVALLLVGTAVSSYFAIRARAEATRARTNAERADGYTVAYMSIEVIGFLVAGLVTAAVLRQEAGKVAGAAA